MRLVGVELTRLRSRRAVVLLLAAAIALVALVGVAIAWDSRPVSDRELASAQAQVDRELQRPRVQRDLERCTTNPGRLGFTDTAECEDAYTPQLEWFLFRTPLDLAEQRDGGGLAAAVVLVGIAALVGATYAGADWASGSMSNQLLVEPRRLAVWAGKAAALALATFVVAVVLLAALWAWWAALSVVWDLSPVPDGHWLGVAGDVGRGSGLAAAAGVGAYALAMLFRNTGATIAAMFLVSVAGQLLTGLLPVERPGRLNPGNNLFAVLGDGYEVYDPAVVCGPMDQLCDQTYVVSLVHGTIYLVVVLALVVIASTVSFRRRDVP